MAMSVQANFNRVLHPASFRRTRPLRLYRNGEMSVGGLCDELGSLAWPSPSEYTATQDDQHTGLLLECLSDGASTHKTYTAFSSNYYPLSSALRDY